MEKTLNLNTTIIDLKYMPQLAMIPLIYLMENTLL